MAARETVKIALGAPVLKEYVKDGADKKLWNVVSADRTRKFVIFDEALVVAFEKAKLEGQEHEYVVQLATQSGRDDLIVEIPNVFEKKRGAGGPGGARGPMFTDRQVALLAAVMSGQTPLATTIALADQYAAWLERKPSPQGGAPDGNGGRRESAARRADPVSPSGAEDPPVTPAMVKRLREEAASKGVDEGVICHYHGVPTLERLRVSQARESMERLKTQAPIGASR